MTRIGGNAGRPRRARRAVAVLTDHAGAAHGAVRLVARLDADRRPGVADGGSLAARLARNTAVAAGHAGVTDAVAVAHHVHSTRGPGGDVGVGVHAADRRPADERAVVALVRRLAGRARLTLGTRAVLADHPGPAPGAVRLVVGLGADGRAGRADDAADPARLVGHVAG